MPLVVVFLFFLLHYFVCVFDVYVSARIIEVATTELDASLGSLWDNKLDRCWVRIVHGHLGKKIGLSCCHCVWLAVEWSSVD